VSIKADFSKPMALSTATDCFETLVDSLTGTNTPKVLYVKEGDEIKGYYFT
jgi:hypothetical protein